MSVGEYSISPAEQKLTDRLVRTGVMLTAAILLAIVLGALLFYVALYSDGPLKTTEAALASEKAAHATTTKDLNQAKVDIQGLKDQIKVLTAPKVAPPKKGAGPCPVNMPRIDCR